jgi:hypothetical protein
MGPLCKRHHHLKHETTWRLRKHADGYEWTDPTGHTYYSTPTEYPVNVEPITYDTLHAAARQEETDAADAAVWAAADASEAAHAAHAAQAADRDADEWEATLPIDIAALTTKINTRRTAARGGTDPVPAVPSTTINPVNDTPPF